MDAKTFLDTYGREEAERVAVAAGTNFAYFYQIALGHRRPSVKLAVKLEHASDGRMTFTELLLPKAKAA